ncbi:MAG: YbaK/EbsC family protein [Planctomycetes bacterium]|nr:YbaK/EbsC family protein [Planctomycetota bacterium]MBL7107103.1 YbaK/EbsC family protein [Phycisphaerae bacterium]
MGVIELLNEKGVGYELSEHVPAFTAQRMAALEHEKGVFVAKPVVVKADGEFMMCVLSANHKVNLNKLKEQLGAQSVELAEEEEIGRICNDCELGAEPPFGNLYNLPTIMDKSLLLDDHITFQAGTHEKCIRMRIEDFRKLVDPKVMDFAYHI